MIAFDLFARMEERYGRYVDSGVVCGNGEEIRRIAWEIDWYMLYHAMTDRHTLYVVHHPVSNYALALSQINPEEEEDDVREEVQNWLLEFKAREVGMNLAVAHTMADRMLETRVSDWLEGARGEEIVRRLHGFFDQYYNPHPEFVILPAARPLLEENAIAKVVLGTYGYEAREGVLYIDECGREETDRALTIPHSLVDATAMRIWKSCAEAMLAEIREEPS